MSRLESRTTFLITMTAWTCMSSVCAQDTSSGQAAGGGGETPEEIVVTGSRIPQVGTESVSPIVGFDAGALEERGAMRLEELLNRIPQVIAAAEGASTTTRALTGTTQLDLRGIGAERTLVLVNGRRMPYGSPDSVAADINQVPFALVKNVEVLTGGASAVYGSDALAGVVNFNLRDDFEGLKFTSTIGGYQHKNDNTAVRETVAPWEANNPGDYTLPKENVWGGFSSMFSVVAGKNFDDGRGNVTTFATFRETDEVKMSERDFSTCVLAPQLPEGTSFTCRPSPVDIDAGFVNTGAAGLPPTFRVQGDQFVPRNPLVDQFNELPYHQVLRDQEQYDFGALAHFEISEHFVPFLETNFYRVKTTGEQSPEGVLNNGILENIGGFNCDNPYFSAQQADFLCGSRGLSIGSNYDPVTGAYLGPEDIATGVVLRRRTIENGLRDKQVELQTFRTVAGVRGSITEAFNYEISANYSRVQLSQQSFLINQSKASQALFAVIDRRVAADGTPLDPTTFGQPACAVNVDDSPFNNNPECAPLDYFSLAGPSEAALDFIDGQGFASGVTTLRDIVATVSAGDLGEYGLASPFAETGLGVSFGVEKRENSLKSDFDDLSQARGLGQSISGSTSVEEIFGELYVPVIDDRPFFQHLSLETAYRYSEYEDSFSTDTYKFGINWEPVSDIRFRASVQKAVRAPNVIELFTSQFRFTNLRLAENPDGSFDPCAGPDPFATFEQCARMGVTAEQYGNIPDQPFAGQLTGGNPDLAPEEGETVVAGVVLQPSFIPGLIATVDRWDIDIEGLVGVIDANIIMKNCLDSGDPFFCGLIHRGAGGTLFASEDAFISQLNINTGSLKTAGWDITIEYPMEVGRFGALNLILNGSYLDKFETKPLPTSGSDEIADCAGYHGFACGKPKPRWRHIANIGWDTPWSNIWLGLTWRQIAEVDSARKSSQPALTGAHFPVDDLSSRGYLDISMAWGSSDGRWSLRGGINNLFDADPPLTGVAITPATGGNGSAYTLIYDSLGRYMFVSGSVEFL